MSPHTSQFLCVCFFVSDNGQTKCSNSSCFGSLLKYAATMIPEPCAKLKAFVEHSLQGLAQSTRMALRHVLCLAMSLLKNSLKTSYMKAYIIVFGGRFPYGVTVPDNTQMLILQLFHGLSFYRGSSAAF